MAGIMTAKLIMNIVVECYSFLNILAIMYCDTDKERNNILGEERVLALENNVI
jgi:hypothetical protein